MLQQHPNITSYEREAHILYNFSREGKRDPSGVASPWIKNETVQQCQIWSQYKDLFDQCQNCSGSSHSIRIDKSPPYLFRSHLVPARLACAFPPTKVIFIFRNPTERTYSDYQMNLRVGKTSKQTFFSLVNSEANVLRLFGVVPGASLKEGFLAWNNFLDKNYKREEKKALQFSDTYLLSRGLYALQLSHWIESLRALWGLTRHELVKKYFLILDNDDLKAEPQVVLDKVLDFVGGSRPHTFDLQDVDDKAKVQNYSLLTTEEQQFLDDFYLPHNAQLNGLLAPYGIELSFAKQAAAKWDSLHGPTSTYKP